MGSVGITADPIYKHPKVDRTGIYKECIRVLSKIIFYLPQDECRRKLFPAEDPVQNSTV